ncbi:MAG: LysR family transcriptional regulator [Alphaproteobacteria bacterium]|nr:LysR family transcriptional regulator [Alphaproteobacteria bacterium]
MDWRSVNFDWNQVRGFLVTVEEGSFSAASRALGLTQPTLGRQVAALEERLGVTLFERVGRSLTLTRSGLELLEHVRAMGDAASRLALSASGQSKAIEGPVCITASDIVSMHLLPPALARIRELAPGIEVEVVASNDVRDLQRREADIAIRHARPEQPTLIARFLREMPARFYASSDYLDRIGRPKTLEDLAEATFIGFDRSGRMLERLNQAGLPLTRGNIKLISENGAVAWELVKRGLGVCVMLEDLGINTPGVECVLPSFDPFPIPVWLVTHRELNTSLRIRLVFDVLAEALGRPETV